MTSASAPGRVNLIGEHTDYNAGFVLPAVIPQRTRVQLAARSDRLAIVHSRELGETAAYEVGDEQRRGDWLDYVQGCTQGLLAAGHEITGFDLKVASDVPLGSGLSSSAALEVATLRGLRDLFGLALDDVAIALLGQRAEVELVGAPVGVMDQMAASLGQPGTALFLDTRSLETRVIPLPAADLIVIASGLRHDHATGDYRTRRAECEDAARRLGVPFLRDVAADDPRIAELPAPLDRRARHVVTENARVLAAVAAIEAADLSTLGTLFRSSHASMRDDFEVSVPAIDRLVAIADRDPDVIGARLTGGGFGGSIVAFANPGAGAAAAARIAARYRDTTGQVPQILVAGPLPGGCS